MYYGLISSMKKTVASAYTARTTAFIAATGISDTTIINALNTMDLSLISNGLDTKMKALYPFVGGTASTHKYNFMDARDLDAAFRLTFNGGWTHSSTGAKPNGTNGYANTFLNPSSTLSVNSNGLGIYITQNSSASSDIVHMGAFWQVSEAYTILASSTSIGSRVNAALLSSAISGGAGFFSAQKTSSTVTKNYKNSSPINSISSGGTLPSYNVYIGTLNFQGIAYALGYVNSEFRLAYSSDGLSDSEISALYSAVQNFNTSLSRNI